MNRQSCAAYAVAFAAIIALVFSSSCEKRHKQSLSELERFQPYISAFTSGTISREATISIILVNESAHGTSFPQPIEKSPFTFTPALAGTAQWVNSRTIEFRPSKRLADGKHYEVAFSLGQVAKVPANVQVFKFSFTSVIQAMQVSLDGLHPMNMEQLKWQSLKGVVSLADVEDLEKIRKLVEVRQGNKKLSLCWSTGGDRRYDFSVDSIVRGEDSSTVDVTWNGGPIHVSEKGSASIHVPAIGDFEVTDVTAMTKEEGHIVVRFSDPLQRKQNLAGLVEIRDHADQCRLSQENNEVHIYVSGQLKGTIAVVVNEGIKNIEGRRLKAGVVREIVYESIKPAVRFVGQGVIIPSSAVTMIPFEAVNLTAVDVQVKRVFESNVPQFLQVNRLDGSNEMLRVGRTVWRKTVQLNVTPDMANRYVRCGFDIGDLVASEPGALYQISLSFRRQYSLYPCSGVAADSTVKLTSFFAETPENEDEPVDRSRERQGYYDDEGYYYDDYYGYGYGGYSEEKQQMYNKWSSNRDNPCHDAYYSPRFNNTENLFPHRNFLVSDIGVMVKKGILDTVYATVNDIKTTEPLAGVKISVRNYQHQSLGEGESNSDGLCAIPVRGGKPYLCIASKGKQRGYCKLDEGSTLQLSHFDVGGAAVQKGLKGLLYGERGVWRPGDSIYLTFALEDKNKQIPAGYPVSLDLINPRGQVVQSLVRTAATDLFYNFSTATAPDAPTGNYTARVRAGGAIFEQTLKIETIMPNRLKVRLNFNDTIINSGSVQGTLSAKWLHGASAGGLKADVELSLESVPTVFSRYTDCIFDDPSKEFNAQNQMVFEGELDTEGNANVGVSVDGISGAPGRLKAGFRTRVFEEGGAFSTDRVSLLCNPYGTYVGLNVPKGDLMYGMLRSDTTNTVRIVTVDANGKPVSASNIQVELYRLDWSWWWERGSDQLAQYMASENRTLVKSGTIGTVNGEGRFSFKLDQWDYGRFLVRVTDPEGGHSSATVVMVGWYGCFTKGQKNTPSGASVLMFSSDKNEYTVGEKATVIVPSAEGGRILVSIENGSRVIKQFWTPSRKKETSCTFDITDDMAPNVYAYAAYLQPYEQTKNDMPLRMYGVIPIRVIYPATKLAPQIEAPEVLLPESKATIVVQEANGRAMTYTLAIVDEGLLDITRFKTPDLWSWFYQREALGVRSWDLFDMVSGAYGAKLERLLAIGGDGSLSMTPKTKGNRFPPMVRYMGPFHLDNGEKAKHDVAIPQYVGSVRIMVVAGYGGAYGSVEKAVPVRKPLMVLATLPRTLGLQETVTMPVSVFAMDKTVKRATVAITAGKDISIVGPATQIVNFRQPGDELVSFTLAPTGGAGWSTVKIVATGGKERAEQVIEIEIRNPNTPTINILDSALKGGDSWHQNYTFGGLPGTNHATLELSRIPPLNITSRLEYLIRYPHGCVEQTTSAAFPQLYLDRLFDLSDLKKKEVQTHIIAAISKLQNFQHSNGAFVYWPGQSNADSWGSCYVPHFLLEAARCGYAVPASMLDKWKQYQRSVALSWSGGDDLIQAYRLYTLSLASAPELGAMNRLRERKTLGLAARWRLAAAYALAGQKDASAALLKGASTTVPSYRELSQTYGSATRDRAMILETLVLLKDMTNAAAVARDLAIESASQNWMSTQETAFTLCALAVFYRVNTMSSAINAQVKWRAGAGLDTLVKSGSAPIVLLDLPVTPSAVSGDFTIVNKESGVLYARMICKGTGLPKAKDEAPAENGLSISVSFQTPGGNVINPVSLAQGTDFVVSVCITPKPGRGPYENVALSQIFPSGWEIRNMRFEDANLAQTGIDYQDIRDDRIYTYCSLPMSTSRTFTVRLNASYLGRFYCPAVLAEAMYDVTINARNMGCWVEVVEPGK